MALMELLDTESAGQGVVFTILLNTNSKDRNIRVRRLPCAQPNRHFEVFTSNKVSIFEINSFG